MVTVVEGGGLDAVAAVVVGGARGFLSTRAEIAAWRALTVADEVASTRAMAATRSSGDAESSGVRVCRMAEVAVSVREVIAAVKAASSADDMRAGEGRSRQRLEGRV